MPTYQPRPYTLVQVPAPVDPLQSLSGLMSLGRAMQSMDHEDEEQRESARQVLRGFIDRIVIPPGDGLLQVVGNLGEMLKVAGGRTGSAAVAYVGCGGGI